MALPNAVVKLSNGNLGRTAPSEDGISALIASGVAVAGKFALGDILVLKSLKDAEALGIDKAYDTANTCLAWNHIKEFYEGAGDGTELRVMIVAKTVTLTQMADPAGNYAKKTLSTGDGKGKTRLLILTRCPDAAYVPVYTDQFEADIWNAGAAAKTLREQEFALHRPVSIFIEGRNFQGNATTSKNLRDAVAGLNANRVHIVISQDPDVAALGAHAAKYANVAYAAGVAAGLPVQRSIARVKNGPLKPKKAALSNGALLSTFTDTQLDTLHDYGYIYMRNLDGKAGFYFNDDSAACPITDDYSGLARGRVMDKAARITRAVYLEELNDDIELDENTGRLAPSTIKHYQGEVEREINAQMTSNKEIVKVTAFVNPDQNVLSTDKIFTELNILPKGYSKNIESTLAYENPLNNQ